MEKRFMKKNPELMKTTMSEDQTKKLEYILSLKENPPIDGIEIKIDWEKICDKYYLTDLFISHHRTEIDWSVLCKNNKIPPSIINDEGYAKYIDWDTLLKYHKYNEQFLEKYIEYINWDIVSEYQDLSDEFIIRHEKEVNWGILIANEKLSGFLLLKYWEIVDWEKIIIDFKEKITEEFLEKTFKIILDEILYSKKSYGDFDPHMFAVSYYFMRLIHKFASLNFFLENIPKDTK